MTGSLQIYFQMVSCVIVRLEEPARLTLSRSDAGLGNFQLSGQAASNAPTSGATSETSDCFEPELWSEFGATTSNAIWPPIERQTDLPGRGDQTFSQRTQYFPEAEVAIDQVMPAPDTSNTFQYEAASDIIICSSSDSIPPGRQPTKRLLCGHPGCESLKLFDRKYELERHMATHLEGDFKCPIEGCPRKDKAFKRKEHLRNHLRNLHGRR